MLILTLIEPHELVLKNHDIPVYVSMILLKFMQYNAESLAGDAEIDPEPPDKPEPEHFSGSHPLSLEALVRRAHDGLGHPGRDRFLRILKNSKASQKVMDIAKNLKCSVCEKFKLPRPSRVGAPPREIGLNEVVGIDTFQLRVPFSNKTKYCLNVVDYGSHFQLVIPLTGHTIQLMKLELVIDCG